MKPDARRDRVIKDGKNEGFMVGKRKGQEKRVRLLITKTD